MRLLLVLPLALSLSASVAPAQANGFVTLPFLPGVGYMVVDDAHQHVFVTGQPENNTAIVELNYSGAQIGTISDATAGGLAIANGVLYAAECGGTSIDEYSTATLAYLGKLTTPDTIMGPCGLAIQGGRLWFSMDSNSLGVGRATSMLIASPNTVWQSTSSYQPVYATDAGDANTLMIADTYGAPAYQDVWDVGASPPTRTAQQFDIVDSAMWDVTSVTPDGQYAYMVHDGTVKRWPLPGIAAADQTLEVRGNATSVAISPDGSRIAVGTIDATNTVPGVDIFAAGGTTPIRRITWPSTGPDLPPDVLRLGWSNGSTHLFVYSAIPLSAGGTIPPTVTTIIDANLAGEDITMAPTPSSVPPGGTTTFHGQLTMMDGASAAGKTLTLGIQAPGSHTSTSLGQTTTAADGTFSFETPALPDLGDYVFDASYAGDATHTSTHADVPVTVALIPTSLTLSARPATVIYGRSVTLTAHLAGGAVGSTVTISRPTATGTQTITGELNSSLNFSAVFTPRANTTYTASYAGDSTHVAAPDATRTVDVAPVIKGSLSGAYARSAMYHLFHYHTLCASRGSTCPLFTEKLIPNHAGHRIYAVLQVHRRRRWRSLVAWKKRLSAKSIATFKIRYLNTRVIGHRYRLAAVFNGDTDHAAVAWGYWYFEITH